MFLFHGLVDIFQQDSEDIESINKSTAGNESVVFGGLEHEQFQIKNSNDLYPDNDIWNDKYRPGYWGEPEISPV